MRGDKPTPVCIIGASGESIETLEDRKEVRKENFFSFLSITGNESGRRLVLLYACVMTVATEVKGKEENAAPWIRLKLCSARRNF